MSKVEHLSTVKKRISLALVFNILLICVFFYLMKKPSAPFFIYVPFAFYFIGFNLRLIRLGIGRTNKALQIAVVVMLYLSMHYCVVYSNAIATSSMQYVISFLVYAALHTVFVSSLIVVRFFRHKLT